MFFSHFSVFYDDPPLFPKQESVEAWTPGGAVGWTGRTGFAPTRVLPSTRSAWQECGWVERPRRRAPREHGGGDQASRPRPRPRSSPAGCAEGAGREQGVGGGGSAARGVPNAGLVGDAARPTPDREQPPALRTPGAFKLRLLVRLDFAREPALKVSS